MMAQDDCTTATATITFYRNGSPTPEYDTYYFSVSSSKKVVFAPGNVYLKNEVLSFFDTQYEYKHNRDGYTDLFNYTTNTGYWNDRTINGKTGTWYNLSKEEWDYLIPTNLNDHDDCTKCTKSNWFGSHRENGDNLWAGARIYPNNDKTGGSYVNGLIILPDNWVCPDGISFIPSACADGRCSAQNNYNLTEWERLEEAGAIFLPAAGSTTGQDNECMIYMSNTANGDSNYYMLCSCQDFSPKWEGGGSVSKDRGSAVRLVRNAVVPAP